MILVVSSLFTFLALSDSGLYEWFNYPGFELWKFVDLALFIVCGLYLHRRFGRPIREALRARSEGIKRELQQAQEERDHALARLAEVEARFEKLDTEVTAVKERARSEADAEKARLKALTETEISKMKIQATREIESAGKAARHELRKFAADESVRLAEEILEKEIRPEDDARLTRLTVNELGRVAS